MMKYDFTTMPDRTGKDALAVDAIGASVSWAIAPTAPKEGFSKIPMWVADMDFRVDEHIMEAINDYLSTGVIGYYNAPDGYYDSFINWEKEEHGLAVEREWIRFSPGVVAGFHMALQILTKPGDAVIINTPVYYPFMHAVNSNGRKLITSELVNSEGKYTIDFEVFEQKIIDNNVAAYILCSPHNPVSRVWTEDEQLRMLEICRKHGVSVISDEIHHDLVFGGSRHIPLLTLADKDDRIIMLTAASKTFNIAGLQNSFAVIANDDLRDEWDDFTGGLRLTSGNPLGYIAVRAAYEHGRPWLDEVRGVVWDNYNYICREFAEALPEVVMTPLEGTYLAWADFGSYLTPDELQPFMQEKCGLAFDYGAWFGGDRSGSFIRINLATSQENVKEMVRRITEALR